MSPGPSVGMCVSLCVSVRCIVKKRLNALHLSPPFGVTPSEFRGDLWQQKTRVRVLSYGVVCVIPRSAVLTQYWPASSTVWWRCGLKTTWSSGRAGDGGRTSECRGTQASLGLAAAAASHRHPAVMQQRTAIN